MPTTSIPAPLAKAGVACVRDVDARPVLAKGGDPFQLIMKTVQSLGAAEALHLIVGFEPVPLYPILRAVGFASHTERAGDVFHAFFYRDPAAPAEPATGAERAPLRPPVEVDVRGLEPPAPIVLIFEKLAEIGPGAQLRVRHHREPVLLYDKLALRGFAARAEKHPDGGYVIHVAPAWTLENAKA